jgi:hypothetical protein
MLKEWRINEKNYAHHFASDPLNSLRENTDYKQTQLSLKRIIHGYEGVVMQSELKLFIDGIEVKRGDKLIRDDHIIIFDHLTTWGGIVDTSNCQWNVYRADSTCKAWEFYKENKKLAPAIFVTKKDGEIVNYYLSTFIYSEKPNPYNGSDPSATQIVYWPASDYYKDGYYVLPENS